MTQPSNDHLNPLRPSPVTYTVRGDALFAYICGTEKRNLQRIEKESGATIEVAVMAKPVKNKKKQNLREYIFRVEGEDGAVIERALSRLNALTSDFKSGKPSPDAVAAAATSSAAQINGAPMTANTNANDAKPTERSFNYNGGSIPSIRPIEPRNARQAEYMEALKAADLSFGCGAAGTGKTFIAISEGLQWLRDQAKANVKGAKLILTRPMVGADEDLGAVPGGEKEKIAPWMRPYYDSLDQLVGRKAANGMMETGLIEIVPMALLRGSTFINSYCVLDEAQNCTRDQLKMFVTRMGEGSKMSICGDPDQSDLGKGKYRFSESGLKSVIQELSHIDEIKIVRFQAEDVVRHPLVKKMVQAFERTDHQVAPRNNFDAAAPRDAKPTQSRPRPSLPV